MHKINFKKLWDFYALENNLITYDQIEVTTQQDNYDLRKKFMITEGPSHDGYLNGMIKIFKYMIIDNAPEVNISKTFARISDHNENNTYTVLLIKLIFEYIKDKTLISIETNEEQIDYFNKYLYASCKFLSGEDEVSLAHASIVFDDFISFFDNIDYKDVYDSISYGYMKSFFLIHFESKLEQYLLEIFENSIFYKYNNIKVDEIDKEIDKDYIYINENKNNFKIYGDIYYKIQIISSILNILQKDKQYEKIIKHTNTFFKTEYYLLNKFTDKRNNIFGIKNENEWNIIRNQIIWLDLQRTIATIKTYLIKLDIGALQDLFHYLNDNSKIRFWKNNIHFSNEEYVKKYEYIIELSRLFLYKKIGKEQFNYLHNNQLYKKTLEDGYLKNFYNLILGKFSLSHIQIGIVYSTKGYNLLLKKMFKNFRLGEGIEELGEFILPEEATNAGYLIDNNNEEELIETIKNEGNYIELKGTAFFNIRLSIQSKKKIYEKIGRFIKPIVSFLNAGQGGTIIIGVWENLKVLEHIERGDFLDIDIKRFGIKSYKSLHDHYLIGLEEIEKNTIDNLQQKINHNINQYIRPNPTTKNDNIIIEVKQLLGKNIIQISIPPSKNIYALKDIENNHIIYIRESGQDTKILDPLKIVEFTQSKIS